MQVSARCRGARSLCCTLAFAGAVLLLGACATPVAHRVPAPAEPPSPPPLPPLDEAAAESAPTPAPSPAEGVTAEPDAPPAIEAVTEPDPRQTPLREASPETADAAPEAVDGRIAADRPRPRFPHPCRRLQSDDHEDLIVDDAQILLEETGCRAALWLDGLFGKDRDVAAARRTHGYLETAVSYSQFDGLDLRTRLRVRFDLPNLKERLSAFVGREDEEDFIQDRSEGFALRSQFPRIDDRDEWLAGLGYSLPDSDRVQTDFKVGAASLRNPRAFMRARLHYNVYADSRDLLYLRATPFWQTRKGVGVTLGVDYNRILAPLLLMRLSQVGTYGETTAGIDWLSAMIFYQNLRKERAIAYELFARGASDAAEPLFEYGGRTVYRHPLVPRELYAELILGYTWPRDDPALERRGSYEIGFGLELPFGEDADG